MSLFRSLLPRLKARLAAQYLNLKHARPVSTGPSGKRLSSLFADARYFCADRYLEDNPDVAREQIDPLLHFNTFGLKEGRTGYFFDAEGYRKTYPDVRATGIDPLLHYQLYGSNENRIARYIAIKLDKGFEQDYVSWVAQYDTYSVADDRLIDSIIEDLPQKPLISVVLPVYKAPLQFLKRAIESVLDQSYTNLELCISDDASNQPELIDLLRSYERADARVKLHLRPENGHISASSNSALTLATGEFIALLDHDDELARHALFWVAEAINRRPDADIFYSDEDKIDERGLRYGPYFKSDFNEELFLAQNMLCHLSVFRHSVIQMIGGFRLGFEGAQDHDLSLRAWEAVGSARICHIPRILYHWRAIKGSTALDIGEKNYATSAGLRAVTEHVARLKIKADVTLADPRTGHYRVRYKLPAKPDKVSIIIPTRDRINLLKMCISSIADKTTYPNYEIIIIDNGSVEPESLAYFDEITSARIRVVRDDSPFNYSSLNNLGASVATGKYLCLMNNDIEIYSDDWLEEMVSFAQRPDIGCVGARLWYPDMTVQHAGVILGIGGVAGHAHKHISKTDTGYFCRAVHHQAFSAVTAACLLIRKDIYDAVNGLDESLAVAFNDVDFCLRVREKGYRNIWTPYAQMIHHESASRGAETTPEKQARFAREVHTMLARWGHSLTEDPSYNPNLTLETEDFALAFPPRVKSLADVQTRWAQVATPIITSDKAARAKAI